MPKPKFVTNRTQKRGKFRSRFQNMFRSGSVDTEKSSSLSLSGDEASGGRSRSYSTDGDGKKDAPNTSPHHHPSEAVWVTSANHPSPFAPPASGTQGHKDTGSKKQQGQSRTTWFLPDTGLPNTPLTSDTAAGGQTTVTGDTETKKGIHAGASILTAQELHQSVLSALGESSMGKDFAAGAEASTSPGKTPLERKLSKKQPKGTFEYIVKDRDTLEKIAAHFDITPSELMKTNRLLSRFVFTGQTLFVPDPDYVPSDPPTPKSASPPPDTRPKVDIPLVSLADEPPASIPGHVVPVTSPSSTGKALEKSQTALTHQLTQQQSSVEDESDRECLQKFLKMPVRRVMEEEDEEVELGASKEAASEGITIKGTLLVTPNAIMFDPDVNDPVVIDNDGQLRFSMVVYMEEIKSVALFHDISPRMFWRQPKELRAHSPKPETYHANKGKRPKVEGQDGTDGELKPGTSPVNLDRTRLAPDGASVGDGSQQRASPDGGDPSEEKKQESNTGRTSEELEQMTEIKGRPDSVPQPGRASEEVEHALTHSQDYSSTSPLAKQMSRSSEMEVCEISQLPEADEIFGHTRDFGPHMGRSSSEVHRQISSGFGQVSDASPGDTSGRSFFTERSDSTTDTLNTPTQGFAPVHFTDRSPKNVTTHPKPVSGQKAMLLAQSPVPASDLTTQENRIAEDAEAGTSEMPGSGHLDVATSTSDQGQSQGDSSSPFTTSTNILSATDTNQAGSASADDGKTQTSVPDAEAIATGETAGGETETAASADSSQPSHVTESTTETDDVDSLTSHFVQDLKVSTASSQEKESEDSLKPGMSSPRSSFSSLRAPAQHISSFFNYTSSFFRSAGSTDKERLSSSSSTPPATPDFLRTGSKSTSLSPTTTSTSSPSNVKLQLKSGFTKEDMHKVLGPDPKNFLPRSDSPHFEESPLYLQIRPGIQRNIEIFQPRAFDHRNLNQMLEEYWFVVPRDMGDKLYNFLMEWQPDAYGDEEETETREKFFYDVREVANQIKPIKKGKGEQTVKESGAGDGGTLPVAENHFGEMEKTWEILSKEEVYGAEKEQALHRQDTIDESFLPELIGDTVIIDRSHMLALVRTIPRNMTAGYNWELVFTTQQHGYSLMRLYGMMEEYDDAPILLFIRDAKQCVFGAYLSNHMKISETFYGSGSTFLFTFYPHFKRFLWQGDYPFFINGTRDFFAVGSGDGLFGLWLDNDLDKGRSHRCLTFRNDVLTKDEDFKITDLEVWRFVDSSLA